jgi:hypothetical protein
MSDISVVNADGFSGFKRFEAVPFSVQNLQLLTAPFGKEAIDPNCFPIEASSLFDYSR